ncbi:pRiA4b ORF-3-like protein [Methanobrevibacter millerae]|uniref:PRiA4b ORF-3-like protein n=1 Tax=Methanobrevibacter millerae TaxID=230361 RepID=A0A1G5VJP4_9EURY|nr:pRiA4b ORF-3-like protein [Methanobrevibacter millerae]
MFMKGYDVKIRLDDFRPITWRDMIIPEKITFKELDRIIKITYGFLGYHLSAFTFKDSDIEILDLSNDIVAANEAKDMNETYIDEYFQNEKKIFL